MTKDEMVSAAIATAIKYGLSPQIVCGIADRESSWNPWALRYEPGFFTSYTSALWTRGLVDLTEAKARAFSWGLMQPMGQVAREHGFTANLASLCDPPIGLEFGCRIFAAKLKEKQGNAVDGLLAYNGGGNPNYASEVLKLAAAYPSRPSANA